MFSSYSSFRNSYLGFLPYEVYKLVNYRKEFKNNIEEEKVRSKGLGLLAGCTLSLMTLSYNFVGYGIESSYNSKTPPILREIFPQRTKEFLQSHPNFEFLTHISMYFPPIHFLVDKGIIIYMNNQDELDKIQYNWHK